MSGTRTIITPPVGNRKTIAASIEISPKHALEMRDLHTFIPAGTRVYITDMASHDNAAMALACKNLVDNNLIAVPHIAARRLINLGDLEERVKRYADNGVDDVLVVAGSPGKLAGDISSTMEILASGILDKNGISHIGVAGHPEGTPDFSDEVALGALRLKKQFAERSDARMRIVTQFGFDQEAFINWAEGLAENGIDLPVHLGVAGPAKITTLIKYAAMCGIGNSINFLKKRASVLTTLATSHSPESVVGPIEAHVQSAEKSAIRAIHAFPFGGVKKTAEWLQERGSWEVPQSRFLMANDA
jgi:methylenetetrahydrofolate reductase (NADPH)